MEFLLFLELSFGGRCCPLQVCVLQVEVESDKQLLEGTQLRPPQAHREIGNRLVAFGLIPHSFEAAAYPGYSGRLN